MIKKKDVLILGGGFAGFSCFRNIDRKSRQVTLLTDRNHFLFSPLLPLAAVGTIEVRSIVESVHIYEENPGEVLIGKALHVNSDQKFVTVKFDDGREDEIHYETLVIATGAATNTFNLEGVKEHTLFVKEMKHARILRERLLRQFDRAATLSDQDRQAALTFVVVGAGATGIETACEIQELIKHDLAKYYASLAQESEIQIIEATKDILPAFDRTLAEYAKAKIKEKGILLRTGTQVSRVEKNRVVLTSKEVVCSDTIIWATGNGPNAFVKSLAENMKLEFSRGGRLPVNSKLQLVDNPDIYVMGDCAASKTKNDDILPATAQVAMKQGIYLAKRLCAKTDRDFTFQSQGMLASLGTGTAIADLGFLQIKGVLAWWFWKAAYLTKLISFRNKLSVAFDWIKVKIFGRNTARIEFD